MHPPLTAEEIARLRGLHEVSSTSDIAFSSDWPEVTFELVPRLLDEVERSRALLKRIEWEGFDVNEAPICPECRGVNPEAAASGELGPFGHRPDCELAALIGGG